MFIMQDTPSGNDAWATFQNASLGFLVINNLLTMFTKLSDIYAYYGSRRMRKLCQLKLPWSKIEMSLQSPLPSTSVTSKTWGSHDRVMTFTVFCDVALCTRLEIRLDFGKKRYTAIKNTFLRKVRIYQTTRLYTPEHGNLTVSITIITPLTN